MMQSSVMLDLGVVDKRCQLQSSKAVLSVLSSHMVNVVRAWKVW